MSTESDRTLGASGRRVITGLNESGRSMFVDDAFTKSRLDVPGQVALIDFWRMTQVPTRLIYDDSATGSPILAPPPGGLVARVFSIPPAALGAAGAMSQQGHATAAFEAMGGSDAYRPEPNQHPGMHATRTVDLIYVLSGEIYAVLEEEEKLLKAGDLLVQRGTNHAWDNRGSETCHMFGVLIDAESLNG